MKKSELLKMLGERISDDADVTMSIHSCVIPSPAAPGFRGYQYVVNGDHSDDCKVSPELPKHLPQGNNRCIILYY